MAALPLIDAHTHLQDDSLFPSRDAVFRDLEEIGIAGAVVNGTTERDWGAVTALARQHPWIVPSYGLHPWHLTQRTPDWREKLEAILDQDPQCAVGEIGLDRWIPGFDFDVQKSVFLTQLAMATERNRPATIHCLKAWGALWEIVRENPVPVRGFLLHAYGGPAEMVDGFLRRGAYFSFNGYFLEARKSDRRELFRRIPPDRLLVETDAPAMPLPLERRRWSLPDAPEGKPVNHPANIAVVYEELAELRGWSLAALAEQARENFERLFAGTG